MSFLAALALAAAASPQELEHASPDLRYEMGQRTKGMEFAFRTASEGAITTALPKIEQAVAAFFSLDLKLALRSLDEARASLLQRELHWTDSLALTTDAWVYEPGDTIGLTLSSMYSVEIPFPIEVTFSWDKSRHQVEQLPFTHVVSAPDLDEVMSCWQVRRQSRFELRVTASPGDYSRSRFIEVIPALRSRARAAQDLRSDRLHELPDWVAATTRFHLELIHQTLQSQAYETQLPIAELLDVTERLLATPSTEFYVRGALRQFFVIPQPQVGFGSWFAFQTEKGREIVRADINHRFHVESAPLIIALHGAGGSENMFFEGYGGQLVSWSRRLKWMVAAPRVSASHDVVAFTKRMIELLDADPQRVFFIGHSMGAARLIAAAAELQEEIQPAGIILLGGGRPIRNAADLQALTEIPVYLGWGEFDFALPGATALRDQLQEAGARQLTAKVIENSEHLTVVQVALDDCFAWMQQQLDDDAE